MNPRKYLNVFTFVFGLTLMANALQAQTYKEDKTKQHPINLSNTKEISFVHVEQDDTGEEMEKLHEYINKNLRHVSNVHGKVVVNISFALQGGNAEFQVVKSLNKLSDIEAVRVVKSYFANLPASNSLKSPGASATIPINFK